MIAARSDAPGPLPLTGKRMAVAASMPPSETCWLDTTTCMPNWRRRRVQVARRRNNAADRKARSAAGSADGRSTDWLASIAGTRCPNPDMRPDDAFFRGVAEAAAFIV